LGGKCRPSILSNSFAYGGDASGVKTRLQHLQDRFHHASWQAQAKGPTSLPGLFYLNRP
jgi:hypothetical protein